MSEIFEITLDDLIKDTEPNIDNTNANNMIRDDKIITFFFHGVNFYNLCYNANVYKKRRI